VQAGEDGKNMGGSALLDGTSRALLGDAAPDEAFLIRLAAGITGRPVTRTSATAEAVPYESGSPGTGALARLRGVTEAGAAWSVFVKVLQHPRHWPHLDRVPPPLRQEFLDTFPWRAELGAWDPAFTAALPTGLRVPVLYRQVELPGDRVALWMEDVVVDGRPWTAAEYERAARLLGTFAANRRDPELIRASPIPPGHGLRRYYDGPVQAAVAVIRNPGTWAHPALARHTDLRGGLLRLAGLAPAILDGLDRLPQALPHGDASPQNLLVPRADQGTIVAIDIAFPCPHAVGFDLSQLLVGLVHAGQQPAAELPAIHRLLAPAYTAGMRAGQRPAALAEIRRGYLGTLLIRAPFTALPWADLGSVAPEVVDERAALIRFALAVGEDLSWPLQDGVRERGSGSPA
jgi:hypothetical protein